MEKTEKFRMRKYFVNTGTNIYAAPTCGEIKRHFILIPISRVIKWNRLTFDHSEVKINYT